MMTSHKTTPSLVLPGHPLAKGLVGCWLLNEGSGGAVLDFSGHGNHGTIELATWTTTPLGRGIHFAAGNQNIEAVGCHGLPGSRGSVALWVKPDNVTVGTFCELSDGTSNNRILLYMGGGGKLYIYIKGGGSGANVWTKNSVPLNTTNVFHLAATWDSQADDYHVYIDGAEVAPDATDVAGNPSGVDQVNIGTYYDGASAEYLGDMISAYVYDRTLAASEIAWLHREPFALLQTPGLWAPVITGAGVTHELGGSVTAASSLSVTAKVSRNVSGLLNPTSSVSGALSISPSSSEPVLANAKAWRSAALFNGVNSTAFKLGTVLTGGWFWTRRAGCSVVYRGASLAEVDFNHILGVVHRDDQQVSLPTYLSHEPDMSYCYVVRRFNGCGDVEQTTAAAVVVRIGPDGQLAQSMANAVFGLHASQVAGHKLRLLWFYCPLNQQVGPEAFNVYWDSGNGQIDFAEPLAEVPYSGRQCYSFLSDSLSEGTYSFAVRAVAENQAESMSLSSVRCSIQTNPPETVTILAAEAIP